MGDNDRRSNIILSILTPFGYTLKTPITARTSGSSDRTERRTWRLFFILPQLSSSVGSRKPAQIRSHSPGRCLFPILPAKSHTTAHKANQGVNGHSSFPPVPISSSLITAVHFLHQRSAAFMHLSQHSESELYRLLYKPVLYYIVAKAI